MRILAFYRQTEPEKEWPLMHKDHPYWEEAAKYVQETSGEKERKGNYNDIE